MKRNVLWNKFKLSVSWSFAVLLVLVAGFLVGNGNYHNNIAAYRSELATYQPDSPIEWVVGYVEWDKATAGELKPRSWSESVSGETQEEVVNFIEGLNNPAEATCVLNLALVEVEEHTPTGDVWWALLFTYTEAVWVFVDAEVVE